MVEDAMEITAPSVDEAIILGLTRMAVTREDVVIETLDEGSRGFLGLGARPARVRLTRRPVGLVEVALTPIPPVTAPAAPPPVTLPPAPTVRPAPAPETTEEVPADIPETTEAVAEDTEEEAAEEPEETETLRVATAKAESRPARVPRSERTEPLSGNLDHQAIEAVADEVAAHLFAGLRVKAVLSWRQEERVTLWISLRGRDADMLVGPRAQTLNSVQYLFRTLLHHRIEGDYNVVIDADGYRKRQRSSLESLARKKADQAISTGRTIRLRPMPAHDRRVIHMILRQDDRVQTESIGKGENRAITIIPIRKTDKS
ncbi:MAG TPA: RNA-binding cell elongation regulator Jag/EloR [Anaerolineae bacterium]|nr:RNA-binding cell elongation regulator Jag/EloR [Anaerolineae bacterium]